MRSLIMAKPCAMRSLIMVAALACARAEVAVVGDTCGKIVDVHNSSATTKLIDRRCPIESACERTDDDPLELICTHKSLTPMSALDITSLVLVFISTALAAGGGIGGGGLLVPIFMLVNNFATPQATALSLATISGGSIANLWTYTQRYHPNKVLMRPLIDYDASLLFCPALLAGTMFGSMFSVMFPEWLVVVCLVVLLGYSAYRTLKKGKQKWEASHTKPEPPAAAAVEMSARNDASDSSNDSVDGGSEEPLTPLTRAQEEGKRPPADDDDVEVEADAVSTEMVDASNAGERKPLHLDETIDPKLRQLYLEDTALFPFTFKDGFKVNWHLFMKLALTALLWIIVLVFALLRGGRGGESILNTMSDSNVVSCGAASYWVLFFVNVALLLVCTIYLRSQLLARYELKMSLGHKPLEGDLHWTKRSTATYPGFCIFAGVGAGLLGIGGGMVLGPLLVALGCLPQPVAATSAYVVFITATAGLCQVIILGMLPYDYALLSACVGLLSTFFGQSVVDYIVKKYKKDAIVILVIGAIMSIALVLMTYAGIRNIINGAPTGFSELC